MRRPKLFTGSASKIVAVCNKLAQKYGSTANAIQKLTEDPWADLKEKDKKTAVKFETENAESEMGRDEE